MRDKVKSYPFHQYHNATATREIINFPKGNCTTDKIQRVTTGAACPNERSEFSSVCMASRGEETEEGMYLLHDDRPRALVHQPEEPTAAPKGR